MYKIEKTSAVNTQPWIRPLSERISWILSAREQGMKTVVFLYEAPDSSTFRYRVYNIFQSLEMGLSWRGSYFYAGELKIAEKYLDKTDIIVISRFKWTFELEDLIIRARRYNIKIAFDVDDMVYDIKYVPTLANTLSLPAAHYDFWISYLGKLHLSAALADTMITTNEYLAEKMRGDLGKKTYIIQNFYNRTQSDVSDSFFSQKQRETSDDRFVIGYFSGSPSHIIDFLTVAPEIKDLMDKYDDIYLKVVGYMEMPDSFAEYEARGRVLRDPFVDFVELQRKIAEVDVNIVPLVNNEFSNCKSELKFYEASIVGTPTCATPTYVFKHAIENGVNGFLCERGMWYSALEGLYLSRKKGFADIVLNARRYCIDRYAYYNQTMHIEDVFDSIMHDESDS